MGRDWFNEVACRPGGYSIYWNFWVEGPNGQAHFDNIVLTKVLDYPEVLDCGCGDGTFTLEVAKRAKRVVGIDYAENMIESARKAAETQGMVNMAFVHAHVRREDVFAGRSFDLAYTRRGPHIHTVVPQFVRSGGLLMGIHPEDLSAEEFSRQLSDAGLEIASCERFDDHFHFPTIEDLAGYLSRQPGMSDLRRPEHRDLLMKEAEDSVSKDGDYVIHRPYVVWVATKKTSMTRLLV